MAETAAVSAALVVVILERRKRRKRRLRSTREREWLKRRSKGAYREILEELRLEDAENYRRYLRMDVATLEVIITELRNKNTIIYVISLPISISITSTFG